MATMSLAAYCTMKGCTPAEIKMANTQMLKASNGGQYPALVVECGAQQKPLFLPASKKHNFTQLQELDEWIKAHLGKDLRVAYGFDTEKHTDSANLCLKGETGTTFDLSIG